MKQALIHELIKNIALLFPTFTLIFTMRGFFQAASARLMGDETPSYSGFLTLNPLAHIEVMGVMMLSIMFSFFMVLQNTGNEWLGIIVILALIFMGVRPFNPVPINPSNFRHHNWGVTVTTLAGTFSYFLLTLISMYVLWYSFVWLGVGPAYVVIKQVCGSIVDWALFWGVISLIPIPPFDASALLPVVFGRAGQEVLDVLEQYVIFIFLGLFFIPGVSNVFLHGLTIARMTAYKWLMMLVW